MKPICVAIAVVQHEGRFLVGTRPAGVPLAGLAEFPGGKVHAGEMPADAAARECLEESGLTVCVGEEYPQHAASIRPWIVRRPFLSLPSDRPGNSAFPAVSLGGSGGA